jgi:hypothetical protein
MIGNKDAKGFETRMKIAANQGWTGIRNKNVIATEFVYLKRSK